MSQIATVENQVYSPDRLLELAVQSNADVDRLGKLMDLQERWRAQEAKKAYYEAFSRFQAESPIIQKTKEVKGKGGSVMYKYAPLDDIVRQVSPKLRENGFSFNLDVKQSDGFLTAIIQINHVQGHSERSEFSIPIDKDGFMNDSQKAGSANSYAKRYAFCNALGLLTSDMDDDGQSLGGGLSAQDIYRQAEYHMKSVMENIASVMAIKNSIAIEEYEAAAEAWFELDTEAKQALWVAPKKGGCFTTEERRVIKEKLSEYHPEGKGDDL